MHDTEGYNKCSSGVQRQLEKSYKLLNMTICLECTDSASNKQSH